MAPADERWGLGMGVRRWFVDVLSRGTAPEPDPDELVELETATSVEGPLIVAALGRDGIDATSSDAFDPVTALSRTRVMVRRADLPAARAVRDRLR